MSELRELIAAIRREVEEGLADRASQPTGVHLEAETVQLSIQVRPAPKASGGLTVTAEVADAAARDGHSLTIEFRVHRSAPTPGAAPIATLGPAGSTDAEKRRAAIAAECELAFGAPGFDNAARAEVFCDLVAGRTNAEVQATLAWVIAGTRLESGHPAAGRVDRLRQLLNFAPSGLEAGAEALTRLVEAYPLGEICEVLGERWRFGTHWDLPEAH